jgi:serine/threonine protein kinase
MTGGIGTSQYTAPEVLRSERYGTKVDVFSFNIILWEIYSKEAQTLNSKPESQTLNP